MDFFVHQTAIIDEGCVIGTATKIWHFSHLMATAVVGKNCTIGQNVFIGNKVIVGDNVKIQNNVSIYEGVICSNDVFIGPSAVFTNVINPRSGVQRKTEFQQTILGKGCTIGANATIVCGNSIGEYAFIGAGAVITKSVPAYALMTGNPARHTGWMSAAGCKLNFDEMGNAECDATGIKYVSKNGIVESLYTQQ